MQSKDSSSQQYNILDDWPCSHLFWFLIDLLSPIGIPVGLLSQLVGWNIIVRYCIRMGSLAVKSIGPVTWRSLVQIPRRLDEKSVCALEQRHLALIAIVSRSGYWIRTSAKLLKCKSCCNRGHTWNSILTCCAAFLQACWWAPWMLSWTPVPEWLPIGSCTRQGTHRSSAASHVVGAKPCHDTSEYSGTDQLSLKLAYLIKTE